MYTSDASLKIWAEGIPDSKDFFEEKVNILWDDKQPSQKQKSSITSAAFVRFLFSYITSTTW